MSLDEYLYGLFSNYLKKKKKQKILDDAATVHLKEIRSRLTILARALTGKPIEIYPADREGGYKNNSFFLPEFIRFFPSYEDNFMFYIFRLLYLSEQQRRGFQWPPGTEKSLDESRRKALETAPGILNVLFDEFPSVKPFYEKFYAFFLENAEEEPDFTWLYGKWMTGMPESGDKGTLKNFSEKVKQAIAEEVETMMKANAVEEMKVQQVDKKQQADQVVHNYFEKIETLEEHQGGIWRDFDGDDELDEHANALDELKMSHTVRTDEETHSVYQAEFLENITVSESKEVQGSDFYFSYDEWDYTKQTYKRDFCKLYPRVLADRAPEYYRNTLKEYATTLVSLRKILANINNRYREQRRQTEGDHFDLDAVTDYLTDVLSERTPTEKIYLSKRKREKDLSLLILLDISLSSDGYAAGNRVIDVEKQVSILFGEILDEYGVDFSIAAFFSKTRNFSTYVTMKGFDEPWRQARDKIGAVQPQGYTRIGTALRHAGYLLEKRPSEKKWLLLLSDGKPNDYDRYEGKYGIRDVKRALYELRQRNIHSYALAIEAEAKYYLPQMFGQNHYKILTSPVEMLQSMVKLFEKIKHQ